MVPPTGRCSGERGARRLTGMGQAPMPERGKDVADAPDLVQIEVGEREPDAVRRAGDHPPPRIHDEAVPEVAALPVMRTPRPPLRGGDHERLVLDRAGAKEHVPVVLAGLVP